MARTRKIVSLSSKTVRSTVLSCIVFGLVVQIVAVSFYAFSLTKQYINTADSTVHQAKMSITHGADPEGLCKQVMDIYNGLSNDERAEVGSSEYNEHFSHIDASEDSEQEKIKNILGDILSYHTQNDIEYLYLGMYDKETSSLVYIADPDEDPDTKFNTGEWETVARRETLRFLEPKDGTEILYDIDYTKAYGLMCTVGVPLTDEDGSVIAFVLADIALKNILIGMMDFAVGLTIFLAFMTLLISKRQTKRIKRNLVDPINRIAEASLLYVTGGTDISDDLNHFSSLDINTGDEIEHLAVTMAGMEHSIKDYSRNLLRITKEKERIGTELSLARRIQADMLPRKFPPFPEKSEFDIFALMNPAKEVGGDFYDFFLIDDDHLGIVMADVSGKGVPAALFMMMTKILINNFAMQGLSPAKVLEQTNEMICRNNEEEMFVTVWLGVMEISTGKITAASAGHEYPMIHRTDGGFEIFKDKHGFVIGGIEGMKYEEYELQLEKGNALFLYTDGVTEATNSNKELFGTERLLAALNSSEASDPKTMLINVKIAVDEFVGSAEHFDDLTMLGLILK
jgi:sigma-B regulation protein RsbU (phosphoserine phosphatase)